MSSCEYHIQRRISGPRQDAGKVPSSRERHLEKPPGLHVGRLVVLPPKAPMLVFHKKHGIVLTPLELMHRHDADVGCFPMIVDDLILEYRFVQRSLGTLVVAFLPPQFRQPLFDRRSPTQETKKSRMVRGTFKGSSQKSVHVERDWELKSMSSIRYLGVSTPPRYPRGNSCSLGVWSRQRSNCKGFE